MIQIKMAHEFGSDVSSETADMQSGISQENRTETRLLDELELAIVAGGDSIPCW
jgi:hypothetical protein